MNILLNLFIFADSEARNVNLFKVVNYFKKIMRNEKARPKKKKNCGPGESILIGGSGSEPVKLRNIFRDV